MASRLRAWLKVFVAAAILALLFDRIPFSQVVADLVSVAPGPLVVAVLCTLTAQVLVAYRLTRLAALQGMDVSLVEALDVNLSSNFFGLFLPGGNVSRMAVRSYKLAQPGGSGVASVATVVFDRLTATVALGLFGQAFWLLDRPADSWTVGLLLLVTWAVPGVVTALGRLPPGTEAPGSGGGAFRRRLDSARQAARQFAGMSPGTAVNVLSVSLAAQAISTAVYVLLAEGLGIDIGWISLAWIASATAVLSMLPVTPSGIGVREGTLVFLLGRAGVPGSEAVALSLSFFACTVVLVGLIGGAVEGRRWMRRAEA